MISATQPRRDRAGPLARQSQVLASTYSLSPGLIRLPTSVARSVAAEAA